MIEAELNIFDMVVLGILGLSALIAFFRGFVREVLSLGAWIGAIVITLYTFPKVAEALEPHLGSSGVASGVAGMITFMGSLLGLSILNAFLVRFLKTGSEIGALDNLLGFVFGIARGLLLVAIGFYVMSFFLSNSEYPDWLQTAKTRPYVEEVAKLIGKIAPEYLGDMEHKPQLEDTGDGPFSEFLETLPAPKTDNIFDADSADTPPKLPDASDSADDWPSLDDLRQELNQ